MVGAFAPTGLVPKASPDVHSIPVISAQLPYRPRGEPSPVQYASAHCIPAHRRANPGLRSSPARSVRDKALRDEIVRVHGQNYSVLGSRKMHVMLNRPGITEYGGAGHVARCTAWRLMRSMGLQASHAQSPRAPRDQRPRINARLTRSGGTSPP